MAAAIASALDIRSLDLALPQQSADSGNPQRTLEFSGVFHGHELTRKDRRLISGLAPLDALLEGGIPRGRISEVIGAPGSGKTSLAAAFAASSTSRGEVAAWLDASGAFDPDSMMAAGVELKRLLWASFKNTPSSRLPGTMPSRRNSAILKAAEMILAAGGFGLVIIDFGEDTRPLPQSPALRLARAAERSGAAVIALAAYRMCGTFAALSLAAGRAGIRFSRLTPASPATFEGLSIEATVARNKMGAMGRRTRLDALVDPIAADPLTPIVAPRAASTSNLRRSS
ncbi:MAG TPA: ATPase domain-containing protein [Candidatus Binataceae bacterium]|nr:ATPase domain-containing protein [Candidatus Binataceae bacterium]